VHRTKKGRGESGKNLAIQTQQGPENQTQQRNYHSGLEGDPRASSAVRPWREGSNHLLDRLHFLGLSNFEALLHAREAVHAVRILEGPVSEDAVFLLASLEAFLPLPEVVIKDLAVSLKS